MEPNVFLIAYLCQCQRNRLYGIKHLLFLWRKEFKKHQNPTPTAPTTPYTSITGNIRLALNLVLLIYLKSVCIVMDRNRSKDASEGIAVSSFRFKLQSHLGVMIIIMCQILFGNLNDSLVFHNFCRCKRYLKRVWRRNSNVYSANFNNTWIF